MGRCIRSTKVCCGDLKISPIDKRICFTALGKCTSCGAGSVTVFSFGGAPTLRFSVGGGGDFPTKIFFARGFG